MSPICMETVVVFPEPDDCDDIVEAAQSSLAFWDNPADDADWNDLPTAQD
jgi:hypothetical protein